MAAVFPYVEAWQLHAGDLAVRRTGEDGMIAGDLVDEIPSALRALSAPEEIRPW